MRPIPPTPATENPYNLTDECTQIVTGVLVPVYAGGGKTPEIKELRYRVFLKSYTTQNDTLNLLQIPLLRNVGPIYIYDQGKNRGFVVKVTIQEVCDIYKLPAVSFFQEECG
jgi:hypothetical protein